MILLDTHAVLWLLGAPERLSIAAVRALEDTAIAGTELAVSCLSLYEIAYGVARNRIVIRESIESFLAKVEADLLVLPVTRAIAIAAAGLISPFPGDPFDRIIAATALTEGIPLVTADERIRRSGVVRTIW
jgi:PIN domain nuclease of toxin-antitoxin system